MIHRVVPALAGLLLLVACQSSTRDEHIAPSSQASAPAAPSAASEDAQGAPDRLDARMAVPLLPMMANHQKQNMRDHLLAVEEIVLALAGDDFSAVESAAERIGYSEQMGQMCTHMGSGASGFTEQALNFHHTADTIIAAARKKDREAVMQALGATLKTCTGCHAAFRQRVVDEVTWNRLTAAPAPRGHASSR